MKFTLKNATQFQANGLKGWSYNSADDFSPLSGVYMEITDSKHGKVKTLKSDRAYLVIEGNGVFEIDNNKVSVEKSDMVIVPKGTQYDFWAKDGAILKLFLVHSPAFDPSREVTL